MTYAAPASDFDQTHLQNDAGEGAVLPEGLALHGVSRLFDKAVALEDVEIGLPAGQFSVLLEPSGCGKSGTVT